MAWDMTFLELSGPLTPSRSATHSAGQERRLAQYTY